MSTENTAVTSRKQYTSRATIEAMKHAILEFVRANPNATVKTVVAGAGYNEAGARLTTYCLRKLVSAGALLPQGTRRGRAYTANPEYVPPTSNAPRVKTTRVRKVSDTSAQLENAIVSFLSEHAASAQPGLIANVLDMDSKVVAYHCRRLAKSGKISFAGTRGTRVYMA